MCPLYVSGLIGPGDRKSIQPMAKRLALGEYDQLHHFIAAGVWDATPVETELLVQADRLTGTGGLSGLRGEGGFEGEFGRGSDGTLDYWFE
jgi:SRSO17 transposase